MELQKAFLPQVVSCPKLPLSGYSDKEGTFPTAVSGEACWTVASGRSLCLSSRPPLCADGQTYTGRSVRIPATFSRGCDPMVLLWGERAVSRGAKRVDGCEWQSKFTRQLWTLRTVRRQLSLLAFLVGQNFNLPLTNLCMRFFKNLGVSFFPENQELLWSLLKYI